MAEGSSGHHPGGNRRPHRTGHHQLHNLSFQPMIEESFPLFTADEEVASERELYKPQNKMFHFCKTFCSKITLVNTIQNVILNPI